MQSHELKGILETAYAGQIAVESVASLRNYEIKCIALRRFNASAEFFKSFSFHPESNTIILEMTFDQALKLKQTIA